MKFYYPEWKKEDRLIINVEGIEIPCRAQDVRPSLMYLRLDHGDFVRFIDHYGLTIGKDYPSATVHSGGFARLGKINGKERYLDIFLRESDVETDSGYAAFDLYKFLYGEVITYENIHKELEKMKDSYFADKVFHDGIMKMIVKYLRDVVQTEYDAGFEPREEQTLKDFLGKCKSICNNKRANALAELEKERVQNNRRDNAFKANIRLLDGYKFQTPASEDERKMVCVNEEDAEEYDKFDDDPYYM